MTCGLSVPLEFHYHLAPVPTCERVPMRSVFAFVLLIASVCAPADERAPESDMQGGCDTYKWNMTREFNLLHATPWMLTAQQARDDEARWTPLDRRLELTLAPQAQVRLLTQPGRSHDATSSYAGLLKVIVPRTSTYRISANQRLWIEVVGPDGVVKSSKFQMRTGCDKLVKSVAFALEPDVVYWVQLTGSPVPDPVLLITLDR